MRAETKYLEKHQTLRMLKNGFAVLAVLFLLIFIISLLLGRYRGMDEAKTIKVELDYTPPDLAGNDIFYGNDDIGTRDDLYYISQIEKNTQSPQIDSQIIGDLLWEYSEFNKSKDDIISVVDTSIYISKIYLTYDEKIEDALEIAMNEMERIRIIIKDLDAENKTEYEKENLSMLSSIYQLMGIKNVKERNTYYVKASHCIEELLKRIDKREEIYGTKLLDLVCLEEKIGNKDHALELLSEWSNMHYADDKELYFKYILILLDDEGNENEIEKLLVSIEKIDNVKEDYRYEKIKKMAYEYLGNKRNYN